jgi:glycosyl hydrolase family 42 (putative beta-galactosidase)
MRFFRHGVWLALLLGGCVAPHAPVGDERVLFNFEGDLDADACPAHDVRMKLARAEKGTVLRLASGHRLAWPGVVLRAPHGYWDLSAYTSVALDVRNVGSGPVTVCCRVDNPGADGVENCVTGRIRLGAGQSGVLTVPLVRKAPASSRVKLFGMRGYPSGFGGAHGIDPAGVTQLVVFVPRPKADHLFEIDNVRARGRYVGPPAEQLDPDRFFPMIDMLGQYRHADWPGKTRSIDDLAKARTREARDLAGHPGPAGWNKFGGWGDGPQLEATGFFRAAKHKGKWWLVDPAGRLFWSHGVDCVHMACATTPITDREHWFAGLPKPGSGLARFYGKSAWAPHGDYKGKTFQTYNFTGANLLRKYGADWADACTELTHQRLRSWRLNTVGNWSDARIYLRRRTPYVVAVHFGGRELAGSKGYWRRFRDVFDPSFGKALERRLAREKGESANDPWCIGYFVDNELSWGDELSLAVAALVSPPDQPAKVVFLADLKAKYGTVDKLNQAWGMSYSSWDALRQSRRVPDRTRARADLAAFYTKTAEQYFRTCRDAVKKVAPHNLYLGCRFAWLNDRALRAAAKYCDVIGYNQYRYDVADFRLPKGVDKPVLIGEFHFGALDRGLFHTGLRAVQNQAERAKAYKRYVTGALGNPWIVGTHWFQYGDQATTGRGDGENYQIGLVDVADTPYPETIDACREVGGQLYRRRLTVPTR